MLFVRKGNFAEIYFLASGELIQKYANLKNENMVYIEETGELITHYSKKGNTGAENMTRPLY